MNETAGFGSAGIPYEYTISEQKNIALVFKKFSLISLYVFWVVGLLLLGAQIKLILLSAFSLIRHKNPPFGTSIVPERGI